MADEAAVETVQAPAARPQAQAEVELLIAVQVSVREIAGLLDRFPALEAAAIHPVDRAGPALRRGPAPAPDIFEAGVVHLLDMAGHAGGAGIGAEI